ncbi:MAG: glycosyltransferase family 2 protein [Oscillospiraceae bacterium]|nr:glycosyltransferase family 2 protein [Oscillospiraceae bacterium]
MENSIKFSILVPVYNVEAYIDECIQSVLNQTYGNFELILVDDGSPDRSGEICDSYAEKDSRVKVFHKPNGGAMHSRCVALEKAGGDYIIVIDSDDYIAPDTLEVLAENIAKFNADCILYGFNWLKPGGTEYVRCNEAYCNRLITDKAEALSVLLNDISYNALWRKCVKASCFRGRDFSPYYHIRNGDDRLQSTEILENAQSFLFIPETLYFYRVNTGGITHSIKYDGYKANFTVDEFVLDTVKRLGVFSTTDYNRMRNFALNYLVVELKRLSRFCSSKAQSISGMESIWNSAYYQDFLILGFKNAPALPGVIEPGGARKLMNSIVLFLFRRRLFSLTILFNKYIFR